MTTSNTHLAIVHPCGHDHDGYLGGDFLHQHRITCTSWDLGTVANGPHLRQQWTLRMQRHDTTGTAYALTWVHDWNTGTGALDWDWAVFQLARDAQDGRLSWDGFIQENHLTGSTPAELTSEREHWTRCQYTWHRVRDFLADDQSLLTAFFDVLPPEY